MKRKLSGFIASTLVLGTFIPTALAGTTTKQHQEKAAIIFDGQTVTRPPSLIARNGRTETTYVPLTDIGRVLTKQGYDMSWESKTHVWKLTIPHENLDFSSLKVGSGNTSLYVNGKLVTRFNAIEVKNSGKNATATVYVPIYDVQKVLNVLGIKNAWNGAKQTWCIPHNRSTEKRSVNMQS